MKAKSDHRSTAPVSVGSKRKVASSEEPGVLQRKRSCSKSSHGSVSDSDSVSTISTNRSKSPVRRRSSLRANKAATESAPSNTAVSPAQGESRPSRPQRDARRSRSRLPSHSPKRSPERRERNHKSSYSQSKSPPDDYRKPYRRRSRSRSPYSNKCIPMRNRDSPDNRHGSDHRLPEKQRLNQRELSPYSQRRAMA